ncbi:MAG: hypothetical protein PVJ33_11830 [Lysobacterales bacterium]|jgi:hypothetical protein
MSFFEELKRRNVVPVGVAYAVFAWVLLQLCDVLGEILELPAWGGRMILAALDDEPERRPQARSFLASRANWSCDEAALPGFEQYPG